MTEEKDKGPEFDTEDEITQASPDEEVAEELRQSRVEALEGKVKNAENKYLRAVADFENYKKRVQKEKDEVVQAVTERLLKEALDVKDHLELALSHSAHTEGSTDVKGLREGVTLTLKQLGNFLKKYGVEEVQPLGEAFDPAFHEAIHQEESAEYKAGAVVHVYQKGYLINGRLLRPARVTVAAEGSGKNLMKEKK